MCSGPEGEEGLCAQGEDGLCDQGLQVRRGCVLRA